MTKEVKQLSIVGLLGILFVSLLQGSNTFLSPGIAAIAAALNMDPGTVALVGTVPGIFSVLAGLLAGRFVGKAIKYKTFLVLALAIYIIGGSAPVLFPTWPVILFSRVCVGLGVGTFFALAPALIMKSYTGDAQQKKLGLASVFGAAGGFTMMLAAGALADIQWNFIFLIFTFGAVAFLLIVTGLKEPQPEAAEIASPDKKVKAKLPTPVKLNYLLMFVVTLFGMCAMVFISTVVVSRGFGTSVHAGMVAVMFNIAGITYSFLFASLHKLLKKYLAIAILVSVNIGLMLVYSASSLVMVGVGMFFVGAYLLIIPTLLSDNARYLTPSMITFAASLVGVSLNLGNFALGFYIQLATTLGGNVLSPLFFAIIGLAITTVIFFFIRMAQKEPELQSAL